MTHEFPQTEDLQQSPDVATLERITTLATRARSGEISAAAALSRIAQLARSAQTGETYQKPWG